MRVWTQCELKAPCTVEQSARFLLFLLLISSSCYASTGFVRVKRLTPVIQVVVLVVVLGHLTLTSDFFYINMYIVI